MKEDIKVFGGGCPAHAGYYKPFTPSVAVILARFVCAIKETPEEYSLTPRHKHKKKTRVIE